jgi:hypothetical protein
MVREISEAATLPGLDPQLMREMDVPDLPQERVRVLGLGYRSDAEPTEALPRPPRLDENRQEILQWLERQ